MSETLNTTELPSEIEVNEHLRLRLLEPDDAERVFQILENDPKIQTYITWAAGLNDVRSVRSAIEGFQKRGEPRYALVEGRSVDGYVGMFPIKDRPKDYGIGYFCTPEKRGQGYITKAAEAFINKAEETSLVDSFALYIADDNAASQAVAKKLGFVRQEEVVLDKALQVMERRYERLASHE